MRARLTPILWLAMLAVLVRGLIPTGWMPASDGAGGMRVVICTGTGAHSAVFSRDGKPVKQTPRAAATCAFAATASAPPPEPVATAAGPAIALVAETVAYAGTPVRLTLARNAWPPAQGPPFSA